MDSEQVILIVDDDATSRLMTQLGLEEAGYAVLEASSGPEALNLFADNEIAMVLLDLRMPVMDGFQVCRELQKTKAGSHVPVMVMTGLDDDASISRAFEAGATDFIGKPFNPLLLAQRVRYILRTHQDTKELARNEHMLTAAREISGLEMWEMDENGQLCASSPELNWLSKSAPLNENKDLFLAKIPEAE
ncbi:MAG: response regulator [Pseudomonadales bacterium]|nr:response regulator [Pseudomonadales bacterium]